MPHTRYVIITPARNEEAFIEKTIRSVLSQSILPQKWVIVSDGSTDRTDEIAGCYDASIDFIDFIRVQGSTARDFGSKVKAFNAGYARVEKEEHNFVGNLDADVTFESDYFENILNEFDRHARLGIAGGIIQEKIRGRYISQNISLDSVAGAVQLFRRECYETIKGYRDLPCGGIDAAAEIMARMHGWDVRTFPHYKVLHHRRVADVKGNILHARLRQGKMYYVLGYHPLFQMLRSLVRLKDKPYIAGSMCVLLGYFWSFVKGEKRALPPEVVRYLRREQIKKLALLFKRKSACT